MITKQFTVWTLPQGDVKISDKSVQLEDWHSQEFQFKTAQMALKLRLPADAEADFLLDLEKLLADHAYRHEQRLKEFRAAEKAAAEKKEKES